MRLCSRERMALALGDVPAGASGRVGRLRGSTAGMLDTGMLLLCTWSSMPSVFWRESARRPSIFASPSMPATE